MTANPNLGSTARTLQDWLLLGKDSGVASTVCVREDGLLAEWLRQNDVPFVVDPMPWPNKWNPVAGLRHVRRLARALGGAGKIDIVHCNEHDIYPFGLMLARVLKRPRVCHVRYKVQPGFARWAFGGRRLPDALLWTSRQQRDDCADAIEGIVDADRQHVISLGLDLKQFGSSGHVRDAARDEWGIGRDAVAIGTASALRPRKRIEDFVEVVRTMAEEFPQVVGVLAGDARPGDEGYRDQVQRQVDRAGLGPRFRWLGRLKDVERFYHAIDLFVSTSEYETFGMSVLEAMACRKPVAAYRGGSVAEVVADAGLIVETGDLEGLVSAVRKLARFPDHRESVARRGRDRVAEVYNPANSLRQLCEIYASIARHQLA